MTHYLSKYLLIMEIRFDAILYSKLGNENSDTGHIKCSRGPQVPHPCLAACLHQDRIRSGFMLSQKLSSC